MMYLIKTNKAFNKDFILYSIVLLSLFFIALTTLNAQSKPDAPTIELVQVQATHTTVQWNPVTDATFYYIFVCNETNQCNIGILYDANHNQKTTPYLQTITPLTPNTSYSITITAYANNQWSDYSNWIHIKTKKEDTIPLTQQTNQGQQNQQNNPQTPQQPEQQQSPQQDQQQGGVQQQTPQQQDDPNACRWVVQSRGTPYSECSNNKELISEYTPTTYVCGGADNCQGNCGDSIKGSIRQADDRTGSTDCSATNQFCSADITGVRCVSPKCEWIDKRKTENKVCLTKKNVFIEPQQEQVCGTPGCQGTCWDIENGNFWDSTERRYVSFRNVERPQGYTRTLPQRQGTRIDRCKVTEECKNGSCVYVAPYVISQQCFYSQSGFRGYYEECHKIYNNGDRASVSYNERKNQIRRILNGKGWNWGIHGHLTGQEYRCIADNNEDECNRICDAITGFPGRGC